MANYSALGIKQPFKNRVTICYVFAGLWQHVWPSMLFTPEVTSLTFPEIFNLEQLFSNGKLVKHVDKYNFFNGLTMYFFTFFF